MKYKIAKETKPTLSTFGKYKAKAVHYETIETRQLLWSKPRPLYSKGTGSNQISCRSFFWFFIGMA